jgi:hypothetical protein
MYGTWVCLYHSTYGMFVSTYEKQQKKQNEVARNNETFRSHAHISLDLQNCTTSKNHNTFEHHQSIINLSTSIILRAGKEG